MHGGVRPWGGVLATCIKVAFLVAGPGAVLTAAQTPQYIVTFGAGTSPALRAAVVRGAGGGVTRTFSGVTAVSAVLPNERAVEALQRDPSVTSVVPDRPVFAFQRASGKSSGGGGGSNQVVPAGVLRVGIPSGTSNGSGVGIAVLDTGIDLTHPDLAGTVDAFSAFGGSCQDGAGHGTHVAGIVGARDDGAGILGVAPAAQLYCVKVLDDTGSGSDSTVMAGLDWVLQNAAGGPAAIKVVNMSLGRRGSVDDNPALRALVDAVTAAGIAIVVAAGNDSSTEVSAQIPAAYPAVLAVASTTALTGSNQCRFLKAPIGADTASYFTTDGVHVAASAPGEEREDVSKGCLISSLGILSTRLGGGTTRMSGTSMAAPHVSGIAARYFQQNGAFTSVDIREFLAQDAVRVGVAPLDSPTSGYSFDGTREGVAQAP